MSLSPMLRKAAYALPLVFAVSAGGTEAAGLASGVCYTDVDAAKATLKQEGQRPVLVGNIDSIYETAETANLFFVNNRGYGYNVDSDKPLGQDASKICVAFALKDIHLNNPNNPEIPSWGKFVKPQQGGIDVEKAYQNGGRLILGGQSYTNGPDGKEIPGKYVMVILDISDPHGHAIVWSVDYNGIPDSIFSISGGGTTQHMKYYLEHPSLVRGLRVRP